MVFCKTVARMGLLKPLSVVVGIYIPICLLPINNNVFLNICNVENLQVMGSGVYGVQQLDEVRDLVADLLLSQI